MDLYYINTNEIPGEHDTFICENNMLLHMWNDRRCYGYIIIRAFSSKKTVQKWNSLEFHWCLYDKQNIT